MSTKLKEILTKNWPYPTPLNPISSQAKADPGLAPAMYFILLVDNQNFQIFNITVIFKRLGFQHCRFKHLHTPPQIQYSICHFQLFSHKIHVIIIFRSKTNSFSKLLKFWKFNKKIKKHFIFKHIIIKHMQF